MKLWRHLYLWNRRLWRASAGAAAAEFAVIVPVIATLLAGTVDLAQLANEAATLDAALRMAADYATTDPTNTTAISNVVTNYATFAGTVTVSFPAPDNTDASSFAPPEFCTCDDGTGIVCSSDTTNGGAVCTSGPKHYYVKVQATETVPAAIIPLPGLPTTLTRSLTIRVL